MNCRRWWIPIFLLLCVAMIEPALAQSTVSVPDDAQAGPGSDIVIPITVDPADGVLSMDLSFAFDPAVLQPVGVYKTKFSDSFTLTYNIGISGLVDISLFDIYPLAGSGEVAWVLFRVLGGVGTSSTLNWVEDDLNEGMLPSVAVDGLVQVVASDAVMSVPDDANAEPGTQVVVPIDLTPADGMEGADIRLYYNPEVLQATAVARTTLTSNFSVYPNLQEGRILITMFAITPLTGSGAIIDVTFDVVGELGEATPLDLRRGDVNEGLITTVLDDGLFRICYDDDVDLDGFTGCDGDCDDGDPDVYPGAPEICDGVDNQCPGDAGYEEIDEGGDAYCDNGQFCDGAEWCDGGNGCLSGSAVDCSHLGDSCNPPFCDETNDQCATTQSPDDLPCEDLDACTDPDTCQSGICTPGGPVTCFDDNSCTSDACDSLTGCVFDPLEGDSCDDGFGCGQCWVAVCQTQALVPVALEFDGLEGGILGGLGNDTGFTHMVPSSGGGYVPAQLEVLGDALTVTTDEGDFGRRASGAQNDQNNALSLNVDATGIAPLCVSARLVAPWDLADDYQSAGIQFGVSEDDYVKFVAFHNSSAFGGTPNDDPDHTGFQVGIERTGSPGVVEEHNHLYPAADGFQSVATLDLFLEADPVAATVTACYRTNDGNIVVVETGLAITPDAPLFTDCSFAGILHTNNDFHTAAAGGDPDNSPWHPRFDRFSVSLADADSDGFTVCQGDCDHSNPDIYPDAPEICDGVDNQCPGDAGHGQVDEGFDIDTDGHADCTDNCPGDYNPGQADADSDGAGDACDDCPADPLKTDPGLCGCGVPDDGTDSDLDGEPDCTDPDDDNDGVDDIDDCARLVNSVSEPPGEVGDTLRAGPEKNRLSWQGIAQANVYNVYRGALPADYDHVCFESEWPDTAALDTGEPLPGELFYYLVGGTNVCGSGGVGTHTDSTPRPVPFCAPQGADGDSDGVLDINDNCPLAPNPLQEDADSDGIGDVCDPS